MKKKAGTWADTLSPKEISFTREKYNQIPVAKAHIEFRKLAEKTFTKVNQRNPGRSFDETDNIKSSLFEIRFGSELIVSQRCSNLEYEFKTGVGNTTVDFKFEDESKNTWYLELTSLRESQRIKDKTWSKGNYFGYMGDASDETAELLRVQEVLSQKVWDEKLQKPLKFPKVKPQTFQVLAIDMRAFLNAGSIDSDHKLICYGNELVESGYKVFIEGEPFVGVFNKRHPAADDLETLRERVHFIVFVNEKNLSIPISRQHLPCWNPNLFNNVEDATEVWRAFPLSFYHGAKS